MGSMLKEVVLCGSATRKRPWAFFLEVFVLKNLLHRLSNYWRLLILCTFRSLPNSLEPISLTSCGIGNFFVLDHMINIIRFFKFIYLSCT